MKEMTTTKKKEIIRKKELLTKIAGINGRYVCFPLFDDGLYQTLYRDGTDAFIGPLDKIIEWEKGYTNYQKWEKRHGENQDDWNKR